MATTNGSPQQRAVNSKSAISPESPLSQVPSVIPLAGRAPGFPENMGMTGVAWVTTSATLYFGPAPRHYNFPRCTVDTAFPATPVYSIR